MRIAIVGSGLFRFSFDDPSYVVFLAQYLASKGHQVTVIDRRHDRAEASVERSDGLSVVRLGAPRFDRLLRPLPDSGYRPAWVDSFLNEFSPASFLNESSFALCAGGYLSRRTFDVIQSYSTLSSFLLLTLFSGFRRRFVYASITNRRGKEDKTVVDRLALLLENTVGRLSRKIVFCDELTLQRFRQDTGVAPRRTVLIPIGVEVDLFRPGVSTKGIREKYELTGEVVVLFVGRIAPEKGVAYLIEAADFIVRQRGHTNVMFLLVGPLGERGPLAVHGSPYASHISNMIQSRGLQGHVKMLGEVPRSSLPMLYSASDIFVLPTLAEQSPVVVKEAMAAGRPVVSTLVDGLPALVREGENGFLVEPRHVEPLALRLEELIADENLRRAIGENNRRRAVAEFGLPAMGEAWVQLLRSLGVEHDSKGHRRGRR